MKPKRLINGEVSKMAEQEMALTAGTGVSDGIPGKRAKSRIFTFGSRVLTRRVVLTSLLAVCAAAGLTPKTAYGQSNPLRIGLSVSQTGGAAPITKQVLAGLELWRDDVNAKGGILGRKVELVYYDDQSSPANVPGIYTKLISVDKVDITIGPYGTNLIAAAMPTLMQNERATIGFFGFAVNKEFKYPRYFSMQNAGSDYIGLADGFFQLAAKQNPKPTRVALLGADAEFGKNALEGARESAKKLGFTIVYDRYYPPATNDFAPIIRAIQATKPDIVYSGSYLPDTVGIVRASSEVGLKTKMFGGALLGLLASPIKAQLGSLINNIVTWEIFAPSRNLLSAESQSVIDRYQKLAPTIGTDPIGMTFPPFAYAVGQIVAQAVEGTKGTDQAQITSYLKSNTFQTVVGSVRFGADGEWAEPRNIFVQYQGVVDKDVNQFKDPSKTKVLWPPELADGPLKYPYSDVQ